MGFRKTAVALTVLALALAVTGCKARERYLNAREAYVASRPLICYEDYVQQHGLSDAVDSAFCTFHFER